MNLETLEKARRIAQHDARYFNAPQSVVKVTGYRSVPAAMLEGLNAERAASGLPTLEFVEDVKPVVEKVAK